jgi:hypothetical protein
MLYPDTSLSRKFNQFFVRINVAHRQTGAAGPLGSPKQIRRGARTLIENPQSRSWIGGAKRDRTADLLVANEALSQLSYSPTRREQLSTILAVHNGNAVSGSGAARRLMLPS